MHEFSLMNALLRKIEAVAREEGATQVVAVSVQLGALSHLSPDHFREHFANGARDSVAEGAHLEIEVSDDPSDPSAQDILLKSVELA